MTTGSPLREGSSRISSALGPSQIEAERRLAAREAAVTSRLAPPSTVGPRERRCAMGKKILVYLMTTAAAFVTYFPRL